MGPVPLRTALGAGRLDFERLFDEDLLRAWLPDDRVFEEAEREVLLLDDAGGEDVRVAMLPNLRDRHTSHRLHTPVSSALLPSRRIRPAHRQRLPSRHGRLGGASAADRLPGRLLLRPPRPSPLTRPRHDVRPYPRVGQGTPGWARGARRLRRLGAGCDRSLYCGTNHV